MLLEDRSLLRAFTSGNWRYIAAQRHFDQAQAVQASLLLDQSLRQLRQGLLPTIDNWGPVVHEELYNLATDPNEHQSVVDQNPAQMAIMRQLYTDYKAVVDATPKTLIPPQLRAPLPPEQPQLFTITPAAGPTSGGNSVVLTGKLLSGATRVMFGNTQTTNFTVNSSGNQLTVVAPAHTLSTVDVWGHVNVRVWGSGWYSYPLIYDYTSPPVAAFTASTVTGRAPLRVQFTDTSSAMSAPITEWHWSFGDGWLSDQQNPVHYYVMAGVYTVTLTVKNADGTNTAASPTLVHVDPCFIDFLVVPSSGPGPLAVQFVDESTPDSPITSWDWNFGDGTRSNEQNPAHVFTERGAYTVELTVTTANGTYTFGKTWCVDIGNALPAQTALALLLLIGILAATGLVRIVLRNGG
jgi:PKD repeat protein